MANDTKAMSELLYTHISNMVIPCESGATPSSFVSIMPLGLTVEKGEGWVASLVDVIPKVRKMHEKTVHTVSDVYKLVLTATPPPNSPEDKKRLQRQYDEAMAFLTDDVMRKYHRYFTSYSEAKNYYLTLFNRDPANPARWNAAKKAMTQARNEFVSLGRAKEVESYLAIVKTYAAYEPETLFANALSAYDIAVRRFPGGLPVSTSPEGGLAAPETLSWTTVHISGIDTHPIVADSIARLPLGGTIWPFGEQDVRHTLRRTLSTGMTIRFDLARIDIVRHWFSNVLFAIPGVKQSRFPARGSICPGPYGLTDADAAPFPCMSTSLLLSRNLRASFDGSAGKPHASITIPGVQIIGFVNTLLPVFPG